MVFHIMPVPLDERWKIHQLSKLSNIKMCFTIAHTDIGFQIWKQATTRPELAVEGAKPLLAYMVQTSNPIYEKLQAECGAGKISWKWKHSKAPANEDETDTEDKN